MKMGVSASFGNPGEAQGSNQMVCILSLFIHNSNLKGPVMKGNVHILQKLYPKE